MAYFKTLMGNPEGISWDLLLKIAAVAEVRVDRQRLSQVSTQEATQDELESISDFTDQPAAQEEQISDSSFSIDHNCFLTFDGLL